MRIPRTEYMMLGRIGSMDYLTRQRTSPSFPQNILRHTLLNGIGCTTNMLRGLGDMATQMVDPSQGVDAKDTTQDAMSKPAMPASALPAGATGMAQLTRGQVLAYYGVSLLSGALCAYHGWKRDHRPISAWGWWTLGTMFPIIAPGVALYQGFGRRRR